MELVEFGYLYPKEFPRQEQHCLTNRLRRAAVSVPSNIAEGKGRSSDKELIQFLNHARGSLYEVQTQIKIANRLHYLDTNSAHALDAQAANVGRLLNGLIRRFQTFR